MSSTLPDLAAGRQPVNVTNKVAGGGSAALAGNILVGSIIGIGIDAATGASLDLVPNPVSVDLTC